MIETAAESQRDLLVEAAGGDRDAGRALLDLTGETVYGFVYARVGGHRDVAEDLTQATFVEAIRSAKTYRGESSLETWLCAIARRRIAKHFEAERRRDRLERKLRLVATETEEEEPPEESFADGEALITALGRLMPLHRQVLVLKYLDGRSVEQIAHELKRTAIQIQSLLQRARAALRRALEEASVD